MQIYAKSYHIRTHAYICYRRALAGRSPPVAPRRSLPANRAAQVSPRQLCRAGLSPLIAPPWTALSTPWLHWISCKIRSPALDQGLGRCLPTCVHGGRGGGWLVMWRGRRWGPGRGAQGVARASGPGLKSNKFACICN